MALGLDDQFYKLLKGDWISKIEFPEQLNASFFQMHADNIFIEPYKVLANMPNSTSTATQLEVFYTLMIEQKRIAMQGFINSLLPYCVFQGEHFWPEFMIPDHLRAWGAEFNKLLRNIEPEDDSYRDHMLHSGYVFLWGLWLYAHFDAIKEKYKVMLFNKPSTPGCIALRGPNKDLDWQFFQQWATTSLFHDIGRFIEDESDEERVTEKLDKINDMESLWLRDMQENEFNTPSKTCKICYNPKDKQLEIELYNIYYPPGRSEDHIPNNMWPECLENINREESLHRDDHGIHSAKILLKLANFASKHAQIYFEKDGKKEPWKRYSYRNYIIPSLSISMHNYDSRNRQVSRQLKMPGFNEFKLDFFERDFSTALLILCDNLASIERIGGKSIRYAMDYEIKVLNSRKDSVRFEIVKT